MAYADDIRLLARGVNLKGALGAWTDRDAIDGTTTPYSTGAFAPASTGGGGGTGNATAGSANTNGSTEQDGTTPTDGSNPNSFNKGGGGSGGAPYTVYGPKDTGQQDLESVINGDVPQQPSDGSFDASSYVGAGSMTSVTGMTDCNDNPLKIRFDGQFPLPDGWDDPDSPPADPEWALGYYANASMPGQNAFCGTLASKGVVNYPTVSAALSAANSHLQELLDIYMSCEGAYTYRIITAGVEPTQNVSLQRNFGGWNTLMTVVVRGPLSCTPTEGSAYCPLTNPSIATEWPIDGSYDLSLMDGTFQTNQYDSEAPANAGGSAVDVKYSSGTKAARVQVTAQGGYMIIPTTGCGGAASGTVKVFNADGTFAGAGDATNTFMNQYLPK